MNCTPVEVVNDQQLIGEQSPIQLLDLDHVNNEDVTFYPDTIPSVHIKQELPDIPSGCTEYGFETQPQDSYSMYGEPNQLEIMETFVINQVRKDIDTACATLGISPDPSEWTADQTQCWVRWTLQQYQLSVLDTCMFLIPGSTLCHFTETDFRMRSMESGSTLYSQLEIWKNARLYNQTSAAQIKPEMIQENAYMSFQDAIPHPAPAISPSPSLSPAPSTCSLDSLSSSSTSSIGFSSSNKTTNFDFLSTTFKSEPGLEKPIRSGTTEHKQTIHLWQFLKELLLQGQCHGNCIKWLDREKGIFKIEDSSRVARLWGKRKNRPAMNYDKLSRSIRQYYKKGIIKKTEHSKRLVYQFCKPYLS
ncbi:SAM pointed domain-containing Ets transcription factor-like [Liolophura sinensis]|uniref:SAM pointed domain-containing Ets transcription factor-like n=1 Tax=Liolophura sinensis TaxID=3198878 RepID=UPI0031596306